MMFDRYERFDYLRCLGCGAVFLDPMPDMATIAGFYPSDYGIYDDDRRDRRISPLRRAILATSKGYDHLRPALPMRIVAGLLSRFMRTATPEYVQGGRMLDVGCGNGRYLSTMRKLGWQVQGVEFSEDGVRVCRKAELPVHHGDLASAGFPDASFDLITVRHVIEHIPEPHPFMAELSRILKPGGLLVIETPNGDALGRTWFGPNWFANDVPRHLILYAPANLALLAGRHGLQQVSLVMDTTPKIFLNSIDYAVGNRSRPSRRIAWRRFVARMYVWKARRADRGDTILMNLRKS
jgi:2-polyprenyl-3-methyl-5-hydroxy-6-metoxy-1,4-benzoquinol methylase